MKQYSREFLSTIHFAVEAQISKYLDELLDIQNCIGRPRNPYFNEDLTWKSDKDFSKAMYELRDKQVKKIMDFVGEYAEFAKEYNENAPLREKISPIVSVYASGEKFTNCKWTMAHYDCGHIFVYQGNEMPQFG